MEQQPESLLSPKRNIALLKDHSSRCQGLVIKYLNVGMSGPNPSHALNYSLATEPNIGQWCCPNKLYRPCVKRSLLAISPLICVWLFVKQRCKSHSDRPRSKLTLLDPIIPYPASCVYPNAKCLPPPRPGWWSQNNRAFMRYFKQLSCRGKRKKCLDIFASFAQLWMPGVFQWARVASGQRGSDGRLSGRGRGNPDQTGSQTGERNHSFLERIIWFSSTDDIRDLYSLVCGCDYYQTRPPLCPRSPVTSGQCDLTWSLAPH